MIFHTTSVEGCLSITVGFCWFHARPWRRRKSPSVQPKTVPYKDGTILGIRWLGDLSVPFRLSPRRQGVPHCFKWVPIRGGCAEVRPGEMFSGRDGANKAADSESPMITHLRRIQPDAGFSTARVPNFVPMTVWEPLEKAGIPGFSRISSGTRNPRLVAGFSVVSLCIYLDNIGSGRGI